MIHASPHHYYYGLALSLLAGLTGAGCSPLHPSAGDSAFRVGDTYDKVGYTTHIKVESCMDDSPDPSPNCL